jgi:hypothetical protein
MEHFFHDSFYTPSLSFYLLYYTRISCSVWTEGLVMSFLGHWMFRVSINRFGHIFGPLKHIRQHIRSSYVGVEWPVSRCPIWSICSTLSTCAKTRRLSNHHARGPYPLSPAAVRYPRVVPPHTSAHSSIRSDLSFSHRIWRSVWTHRFIESLHEVIVSLTGAPQTAVVVTESCVRKIKYNAHVYLDHPTIMCGWWPTWPHRQ